MIFREQGEPIELGRDIDAIVIPDGNKIRLDKGVKVALQQSLGGSHTVRTELGFLARIEGSDADAIGLEVEEARSGEDVKTDPASVEKSVWEVLKTCYDPEIPVDIVELGLIYECRVVPGVEGGNEVFIQMTLTAPGCGMGPVLQGDVERKVAALPGVERVSVEVVLDPPWGQHMMSEAARLQLGML